MNFWKWSIAFIIALVVLLAFKVLDRQFRFSNIYLPQQQYQQASISLEQERELNDIFSQSFTYLDRGKQSFVFISSDGYYVLKFFDTYRVQEHPWWLFCQSPKKCSKKYERVLEGYRIAYDDDRLYAGVTYLQTGPVDLILPSIAVVDRFGFTHQIDLSSVPFAIQRAAVPTRDVISLLLDQGKVSDAKEKLREIVDMYVDEYSRGLYDRDHNFMYNTGFVENHPIRIDVGRLRRDERMKDPQVFLPDLEKVAIGRVEGWMQRHYPQYREEVVADMHLKLSGISNREEQSR